MLDTKAATPELAELLRDPQHGGQFGARAEEEVPEKVTVIGL
jgi:hypothetical protein